MKMPKDSNRSHGV